MRGVYVAAWAAFISYGCGVALRAPQTPPRQSRVKLRSSGFTVGNGLRVVVITEPEATQVSVTMRYGVGAKDDPPSQAGLAHLVEHLMFDQTYEGKDLGARLDDTATYHNAFTRVDSTTYVARAQPERLADLLEVEALRLGLRCQTITDDVFARERAVVLNELREDLDGDRTRAAIEAALLPDGHPYRHGVIGSEATVGALTRDQACSFVDAHYAPGNAVLVVSGPDDEAAVDAALAKMLGRIPRRAFTPPTEVPALAARPGRVEVRAPVEDELVVIAWPLPPDPSERAKTLAVARLAQGRVDGAIRGSARLASWGGAGAELVSIVIKPAAGESIADALDGAGRGVAGVPQWMEEETFERTRQIAIYGTFSGLEDHDARDSRVAAELGGTADAPAASIGAEIAATNRLTRDAARDIARTQLAWDRAQIVTVAPSDDDLPVAAAAATGAPLHEGQRRTLGDGAGADAPAVFAAAASPLAKARTRTLGNGLRVVLLPVSSVPTVEARVVFPVGSADDPADRHGAALLAAYGLGIAGSDYAAAEAFYTVGGQLDTDVTADATIFSASGLDMYIDHLLTGLERLVRNGRYDPDQIRQAVAGIRKRLAEDEDDDDAAIAEQWRDALYGADHPYAAAGATLGKLGSDALGDFKARWYQPAGATLIVTGGFDADLADKWIDYLFADWSGAPPERAAPRAQLVPAAIAAPDEDRAQLALMIAFPASPAAEDRAAQLVAAEMLEELAYDVRGQLAATYGLTARLVEERLAARIELAGFIDKKRGAEALALLATRIAELRDGGQPVAPLFVAARRRVLEQLASVDTGASALAARVGSAVALGRDLGDEAALVEAVRRLTLRDVDGALVGLDPSRSAVLVRGPHADVTAALAALGVR